MSVHPCPHLTSFRMDDLYDVSEFFPAGSIVYVEQAQDGQPRMYIKTAGGEENAWREIVSVRFFRSF